MSRPQRNRQTLGLWGLFALQAFCALFFLADGLLDVAGLNRAGGVIESDWFELVVVAALVLGTILTGFQIRETQRRHKRLEDQIRIASGAFAELLQEHFDRWGLTPSEQDVALLAIKGLSIADIARIRETKEGTIKAQSNAIYRKAGVSGRHQLLSLFIEELMAGDLNVRLADAAPVER